MDLLLDQEYTTVDENKENMMKTLFENYLYNLDKDKEHRTNQKIIIALLKRINYITFFSFNFMIFHIFISFFFKTFWVFGDLWRIGCIIYYRIYKYLIIIS